MGHLRALHEAGLDFDPALTVTTEFGIEAGAEAAHRLLGAGLGIDSVFCANDRLALGAVHAAHDRGPRIPQDLAVAGMDDSELARAGRPALTSVDLGSAERGRLAALMLVSRLEGGGHDVRCETVAPRLVVRESTATGTGRSAHAEEIDAAVGSWVARRDRDEVVAAFEKAQAAVAPIYDVRDVVADPQFEALGTVARVEDEELGPIRMQNVLCRLSATPGAIRWSGRPHGADTTAVLTELGLSGRQIAALREEGAL